MDDFAKTRRGQRFVDFDVPMIAEQLKRIADGLEKKNQIEEKRLVLEQKRYIKEYRNVPSLEESEDDKLGDNLSV
jgi:hypothetical protein